MKERSTTSFTRLSSPDLNLHFSFAYYFHVFDCLKAVWIVEFEPYTFCGNTPLREK